MRSRLEKRWSKTETEDVYIVMWYSVQQVRGPHLGWPDAYRELSLIFISPLRVPKLDRLVFLINNFFAKLTEQEKTESAILNSSRIIGHKKEKK